MILQLNLALMDFFINMVISLVGLLIGAKFINFITKEKNWDDSPLNYFILLSPWFILNSIVGFFLTFWINNSYLILLLEISSYLMVSLYLSSKIYNLNLKAALLFVLIIQLILYIVPLLISIIWEEIPGLLGSLTGNDYIMNTSLIMFFIILAALSGFTVFFVYWGNKIQLVKRKKLIATLSLIPGVYVLIFLFVEFKRNFFTNNLLFQDFLPIPYNIFSLIVPFLVAIIIAVTLKKIAYHKIQNREIRGLEVLEKGKILLDVRNLRVHYPLYGGMLKRQIGAVKAVDGVSFDIKTGETIGLVGESGCGKTTVAKAILGLVGKTEGDILYNNEPIPEEYSKYLRQKIQIVFQDPDASLNPRMKIVDIIAEPLRNLMGITKKEEIRRRVLELLDQVSLNPEHMDRFPHEFSGGQKQRIIIARALVCNPELIILDEPTSALDVSVQAQILNLLKGLQKKYGYGFLFITHNLSVVNHIADRIAVMYLGKFVEIGKNEQIFFNPSHPYTKALLESRSEIDPEKQEIRFVLSGEVPSPIAPPPGCTFNPRCVSDARTKECEYEFPHKIRIEEDHYIWCVNPPVGLTSIQND